MQDFDLSVALIHIDIRDITVNEDCFNQQIIFHKFITIKRQVLSSACALRSQELDKRGNAGWECVIEHKATL